MWIGLYVDGLDWIHVIHVDLIVIQVNSYNSCGYAKVMLVK